MPANIIVGSQWGDEGKGKIIDIMASRAEVVVRATGGNNAGHTVVNHGEVYKLHLIPSGILYPDTLCLIGAGVVLDPKDFISELDNLESRGISTANLKIDPRAHVVMPWHIELDGLSEKFRGNSDIGTTKRGIGPTYMDKYERCGLRMYDLVHPEIFAQKARTTGELKNKIITAVYGGTAFDLDAVIAEYIEYGKRLAPYIADVSVLTYEADKAGKTIMFEGAQATLLDIDFGTYPYVTSSHPISAGACIGSGVGPKMITNIIGVAKAYHQSWERSVPDRTERRNWRPHPQQGWRIWYNNRQTEKNRLVRCGYRSAFCSDKWSGWSGNQQAGYPQRSEDPENVRWLRKARRHNSEGFPSCFGRTGRLQADL